jgi:hypothetical protein
MRKLAFLSVIIPVILLCSIWSYADSFDGYGAIKADQKVTKFFETFQINADFNYYYSGSEVCPNALIGLDKKFKLEPDLWKIMETTPKDFKDKVNRMQTQALNFLLSQHGFAILDNRGRRIGIWYSLLEAVTSVKMKDDRTVIIETPPLNTYMKYDNK